MLFAEGVHPAVLRAVDVSRRFQKFLCVGAIGLGVNQGVLFLLVSRTGASVAAGSPIAILISMAVTFLLNERWTWHDRGEGRIAWRALIYGTINSGGLLINWLLLVSLERSGMNYLLANLIGAGIAAIWNFSLNHALTWRR